MTIGRTGPIEPSRPINEREKSAPAGKIAKNDDTVSISTEAYKKADWLNAVEIVSATPDIRESRVAELKAKINDPDYITDSLLKEAADKIIDVLWPNGGDKLEF
jgi:negative regulator of flagellin synthesis FlgM